MAARCASSRLALRLDALPREELLRWIEDECAVSVDARNRADALIARHKPLPAWCIDGVLLSPDLLPHVIDALSIQDYAAAATCSAWSTQWSALLRRRRYFHGVPREIDMAVEPFAVAVMPDGALCVADKDGTALRFTTAQGEEMTSGPWVALTQRRFAEAWSLQVDEDALLVSDLAAASVYRVRLSDGVELESSPELGAPPSRFTVVDDRIYVGTETTVSVLDRLTLQPRFEFGEFEDASACAVCEGELFVADLAKRGELKVFSLDGEYLRTVYGAFGRPYDLMVSHHGRLLLLDAPSSSQAEDEDAPIGSPAQSPEGSDSGDDREGDDEEEEEAVKKWYGRRLMVLDPNGDTHQEIRLSRALGIMRLCRSGDELFLPDLNARKVHVLRAFSL